MKRKQARNSKKFQLKCLFCSMKWRVFVGSCFAHFLERWVWKSLNCSACLTIQRTEFTGFQHRFLLYVPAKLDKELFFAALKFVQFFHENVWNWTKKEKSTEMKKPFNKTKNSINNFRWIFFVITTILVADLLICVIETVTHLQNPNWYLPI